MYDYPEERGNLESYFESNGYYDRRPTVVLDPVERMYELEQFYESQRKPPIVPRGYLVCPECSGLPDRDEGCEACEDKAIMPLSLLVKCGHCNTYGLCHDQGEPCTHCHGKAHFPQGAYTVKTVVGALARALGVPNDEDEVTDALLHARFRFALDRCSLCRGERHLVSNGRAFKAPCGRCASTGRIVVWSHALVERIQSLMNPMPPDQEIPF